MPQKPTYEELARRVEGLERRVKELEAQPREQHFHYHQPIYQQPYTPPPLSPLPANPPWIAPWVIGDTPYLPNTAGTITWSGGNQ